MDVRGPLRGGRGGEGEDEGGERDGGSLLQVRQGTSSLQRPEQHEVRRQGREREHQHRVDLDLGPRPRTSPAPDVHPRQTPGHGLTSLPVQNNG